MAIDKLVVGTSELDPSASNGTDIGAAVNGLISITESYNVASLIAACEAGDVPVGSSVSTIEYHSGVGTGGNEYELVDAGTAGARPSEDGGSVIHVGPNGLYLKAVFKGLITAQMWGLNGGAACSGIMQSAIDYCSSISAHLWVEQMLQPALIDDDIFYRQGTKISGLGFTRLFVENTASGCAFVRSVANKGFVIDGVAEGERLRWCLMNDISIDGASLAGDIVKIKKVQNFRQRGCQISNTPDRTVLIQDVYDSWFEQNYYQRAGVLGGSSSFLLDDSLGTTSSHNNNVRFSGCTWEGNEGVPLEISGKGTGVGNSQVVLTDKCKIENLGCDDYQLKIMDAGSVSLESLLVVSAGTSLASIPAQIYMSDVKNIHGSIDVAHNTLGATLNSVVEMNGYSRVDLILRPAEANVIDALAGDDIFDNSVGSRDSRSNFECLYMGSKDIITNNSTIDRFQPMGIDVPSAAGLRLRRNGGADANTCLHVDGGANGDIYIGKDSSGQFSVATSADLSGDSIFGVDRNGTPSLGSSQATVGAAGAASALPANPSGYIKIKTSTGDAVVPFYNES